MINTDKNPAYGQAIKELKQEGSLSEHVEHLQIKYRNNRLEADHGKLKRLINPVRGFQSMKTAYATIKGFDVMRIFKKDSLIFGCMEHGLKCHSLMNNLAYAAEIHPKINIF